MKKLIKDISSRLGASIKDISNQDVVPTSVVMQIVANFIELILIIFSDNKNKHEIILQLRDFLFGFRSEKESNLLPEIAELFSNIKSKYTEDLIAKMNSSEKGAANKESSDPDEKEDSSDSSQNSENNKEPSGDCTRHQTSENDHSDSTNRRQRLSIEELRELIEKLQGHVETVTEQLPLSPAMKACQERGLCSIAYESTFSIEQKMVFFIKETKIPQMFLNEKFASHPDRGYLEDMILLEMGKEASTGKPVRTSNPKPVPGSVVGNTIVVDSIGLRFGSATPFYRQHAFFGLKFFPFSRGRLNSLVNQIGNRWDFEQLFNLMWDYAIESGQIRIDETLMHVRMSKDRKLTRRQSWHVVGGKREEVRLYFCGDRSAGTLRFIVGDDFVGTMMSDGYRVYRSFFETHEGVILICCFAHARRKFAAIIKKYEKELGKLLSGDNLNLDDYASSSGLVLDKIADLLKKKNDPKDGQKSDDPIAELFRKQKNYEMRMAFAVVAAMDVIYATEGLIQKRAAALPDDLRDAQIVRERNQYVRPLLKQLGEQIELIGKSEKLLKCKLLDAKDYCVSVWPEIMNYIDNPYMRIDNNTTERGQKPIALERKNSYFYDSERGAKAGCIWHSIWETAKACSLNPLKYVLHLLNTLPLVTSTEELRTLLPWNVDKKLFA